MKVAYVLHEGKLRLIYFHRQFCPGGRNQLDENLGDALHQRLNDD